MRVIDF